jgi:hypothetical protein
MPAKKKVDYAKLIKAVESGKPQAQIIKEFKFNTAAQFKNHYLEALIESGQAPVIQTSRASAKALPAKEAMVSKRGSVVISKAMIDEMGFAVGDKFSARKTKAGISLKKIA